MTLPKLNDTELAAWRGMLDLHAAVYARLDAELHGLGLSMPAYELLHTLEGGPLRMSELAARLRFSGGGVTRLADRLERGGWVTRQRPAGDRRGYLLELTPEGKSRMRRAHAVHLRSVQALFLGGLNPTELQTLAALWPRLLRRAEQESEVRN